MKKLVFCAALLICTAFMAFSVSAEAPISCGENAYFSFDEATVTLTVSGEGAIYDITNYHGGGKVNSPWYSIKSQIKHVIIKNGITAIGKYAFAECTALETVQIPSTDGFIILNSAFEACPKLTTIYRYGTEPIRGTLDLRNVHEINPWTFAYDNAFTNVIFSDRVEKIGTTVFEENTSLKNVYGAPGSYPSVWASKNGKSFYDISVNAPSSQIIAGDVNGDGAITTADLVLIAQEIAGWNVDINEEAADVNGSGSIDTVDLVLIAQKIAGWSER